MRSEGEKEPAEEPKEAEGESSDPGASRHGNFMNYYQFHPAEERARQLPRGVWRRRRRRRPTRDADADDDDRKYVGLDVGCNAGDLTLVLEMFLRDELEDEEVHLLGVDLDPKLIERARENNVKSDRVSFECLDFMSEIPRDSALKNFLGKFGRRRFDVVFSFSITMWIHLNYGDAGLIDYLEAICRCSDVVVIEPQLWKCYRNASRRLRRAGAGDFALLNSLELTGDVAGHIDEIVTDRCGFRRVTVTGENDWGRKLLIYERIDDLGDPASI